MTALAAGLQYFSKEFSMTAVKSAICQAYSKNIDRYQRLLQTYLTDVERQYIERRLLEEQAAIQTIDSIRSGVDECASTPPGHS